MHTQKTLGAGRSIPGLSTAPVADATVRCEPRCARALSTILRGPLLRERVGDGDSCLRVLARALRGKAEVLREIGDLDDGQTSTKRHPRRKVLVGARLRLLHRDERCKRSVRSAGSSRRVMQRRPRRRRWRRRVEEALTDRCARARARCRRGSELAGNRLRGWRRIERPVRARGPKEPQKQRKNRQEAHVARCEQT